MKVKFRNLTTNAVTCGNVFVDEMDFDEFDGFIKFRWITVLAVNLGTE
jgi:hypothetical protein